MEESLARVEGFEAGPAKIANLDVALFCEEDVLRLQISVTDGPSMQILHTIDDFMERHDEQWVREHSLFEQELRSGLK